MTHTKRRHLALLALFLVVLILPTKVSGQSDIPTFNPPVVNVELSGIEPDFSNDVHVITVGLGGGGCADKFPHDCDQFPDPLTLRTPPHWEYNFDQIFPFGLSSVVACGYSDQTVPTSYMVLPDGNTQSLNVDPYSYLNITVDTHGCYQANIIHKLGMELGDYKIVLDHPLGQLSHDFRIYYPKFPVLLAIPYSFTDTGQPDYYLEGFSPNTSLTIRFYDRDGYVATRQIQTGNTGSVIIKPTASRSANPSIKDGISIEVHGPQLVYPYGIHIQCGNELIPSYLQIGIEGQVIGPDPNFLNSKPSRPSVDSTSHKLTSIPADGIFQVLEGPVCAQNIIWWKVNYKGTIGWTGESDSSTYWAKPVS